MKPLGRAAIALAFAVLCTAAHAVEPAHGDLAADFALPGLRFYDFALGPREITRSNAGLLYDPVRLSAFRGRRPVVLIFVSPGNFPAPARLEALGHLHRSHRDRVQFLLIYTSGGAASGPGQRAPATLLERTQQANSYVGDHDIAIPCLVDRMDDEVQRAYAAESARLVLIGSDGRIVFTGPHGLDAFDTQALAVELMRQQPHNAARPAPE